MILIFILTLFTVLILIILIIIFLSFIINAEGFAAQFSVVLIPCTKPGLLNCRQPQP
jgi:ABC-type Na+ efflux pump permease subunit